MIPYGRQTISKSDIDAVVNVLRSDFLTQGPIVHKFEATVSEYCGSKYAVASNSATSALHLACLALGLGPGDYLWTTPNTFVASANCGLYCGAEIDFVDIDAKTFNMCPAKLEQKLKKASRKNTLPKIVIPVHYGGDPCNMPAIHSLSIKYGFKIIEDASHAIGAKDGQISVGACVYSDITVFSFHPVKIITTGEGGMALTNSAYLAEKMNLLGNHGIIKHKSPVLKGPENEIWNYQQRELGFNYRMSDIAAALGLSQLENLENFISKRSEIAVVYDSHFKNLPIQLRSWGIKSKPSYHLYNILINENEKNITQSDVYQHLHKYKIGANIHYIPIHLQPFFNKYGFRRGDFPESEKFFKNTVSLPIYPDLLLKDQKTVIDSIVELFNGENSFA